MNQTDFENLGPRMKNLRIRMHLTQSDVASALGVTSGYICNVENNRTAMSLRILMYYARLLGISLYSLVGQIDSEYQSTALDHELMKTISEMDVDSKEKLLQTIKIWKK